MATKQCPSCGAPVDFTSIECKYCGEKFKPEPQPTAGFQTPPQYQAPPVYGQPQPYPYTPKSKLVAGLLAIFLGGLGIHKFYLNKPGQGIVYILFCWTFIPSFIAFIEGIVYLCTNDVDFNRKYPGR
jgi:TM2 domain-containing membrane protein YozV